MSKPTAATLDAAHAEALALEAQDQAAQDAWDRSEYYAGWSIDDRLAHQARREAETPEPILPCGHISHEDGGPWDYDCAWAREAR